MISYQNFLLTINPTLIVSKINSNKYVLFIADPNTMYYCSAEYFELIRKIIRGENIQQNRNALFLLANLIKKKLVYQFDIEVLKK